MNRDWLVSDLFHSCMITATIFTLPSENMNFLQMHVLLYDPPSAEFYCIDTQVIPAEFVCENLQLHQWWSAPAPTLLKIFFNQENFKCNVFFFWDSYIYFLSLLICIQSQFKINCDLSSQSVLNWDVYLGEYLSGWHRSNIQTLKDLGRNTGWKHCWQ